MSIMIWLHGVTATDKAQEEMHACPYSSIFVCFQPCQDHFEAYMLTFHLLSFTNPLQWVSFVWLQFWEVLHLSFATALHANFMLTTAFMLCLHSNVPQQGYNNGIILLNACIKSDTGWKLNTCPHWWDFYCLYFSSLKKRAKSNC